MSNLSTTEGLRSAAALSWARRLQLDLVRGSLWTLLAATVAVPVAVVTNVVAVHSLGTVEYGRFALYLAAFGICATVSNAGISESSAQWIATAYARGDIAAARHATGLCTGLHALLQAPLVAAVTIVMLHSSSTMVLSIAVVANVFTALAGSSSVVLIATGRNACAARLTLVSTLAAQTTVAGVAASTHAAAPTWAWRCLALLLLPLMAARSLPVELRTAVLRPRLRRLPTGFATYALAAWAGGLITMLLLDRTEIFVLQWDGRFVDVAVFAVATSLGAYLAIPMNSLMGPLLPIAAGLVVTRPEAAAPTLHRALRVAALAAAASCAVGAPLVAVLVGPVFGSSFSSAQGVVLAASVITCFAAIGAPLRVFAFATRSVSLLLRVNGVCLVLDVALAFTLIPPLGAVGAVVALAGGQGVSLLLTARLVAHRLHQPALGLLRSMRFAVVGPPVAVSAWAAALMSDSTVARVVVVLVVGSCGLLLVLRAAPRWRLQSVDVWLIADALPPRLAGAFRTITHVCRVSAEVGP